MRLTIVASRSMRAATKPVAVPLCPAEIPRLLCEQYASTCLLPDCELPAECEEALRHSRALSHAEGSKPARCEE